MPSKLPTLLLPVLLALLLTPRRIYVRAQPTQPHTLSRRDGTDAGPPGIPTAITLFWFNNLEVGICYDMMRRVVSDPDSFDCNAQGDYDRDNNTYALPQTCIALIPKSEALLYRITQACQQTNGKFDTLTAPPGTDMNPGPAAASGAGAAGTSASAAAASKQ
ncbi:uncharacterized protein PFL1_02348 [Pseudozyma flocculosa PF-1]|uniref:Uncharacterized protein n=1 Tax=Pseudozyma flocculosa TaxID=84751 RepID=A0A5C3F5Q0_9BASI|nr:uncharacterized protein PFL1_02348 [Pseudozyma flocculosa PF-1]EPQ30232.1 hypothetical protein PFL1_02348 [Pseudozyma flocculosa PF-1]SPO39834.1 uncharacterized protein PSFLO_05315 [Pseudozyma flocculosa]